MIIQPGSPLYASTTAYKSNSSEAISTRITATEKSTDKVSISQNALTEARLAEIKSKDGMSRSQEEWDFLFANDKILGEITEKTNKSPGSLTSAEIDYAQKARGLVNTMAFLSPDEKALYDKMVASGNTEAAFGLNNIAFIRAAGSLAGGEGGANYDPRNTAITADNIMRYFSHSIVDPSGNAQRQFQALIQFLQNNTADA
ncbi:MAG: hypothetical protein CVU29_08605 [Betaproteobacteria bacterium HGW-Betaproteobacteria-22]|nr:MAG: hypothetical protein CVU29_08605 [Betaproteobacteria bacterium HGW-Betaproteobacteria-22]